MNEPTIYEMTNYYVSSSLIFITTEFVFIYYAPPPQYHITMSALHDSGMTWPASHLSANHIHHKNVQEPYCLFKAQYIFLFVI